MTRRSSKPAPIVTRESLQDMIDTATRENDKQKLADIVGRALVAIFERQTESEQSSNDTNQDNGIGFSGSDAKGGSLTAKTYLKNRTLLDWQVERWTRRNENGFARICKYAAQLNEIALEKRQRKAAMQQ